MGIIKSMFSYRSNPNVKLIDKQNSMHALNPHIYYVIHTKVFNNLHLGLGPRN